jgi:hypothetical protein
MLLLLMSSPNACMKEISRWPLAGDESSYIPAGGKLF